MNSLLDILLHPSHHHVLFPILQFLRFSSMHSLTSLRIFRLVKMYDDPDIDSDFQNSFAVLCVGFGRTMETIYYRCALANLLTGGHHFDCHHSPRYWVLRLLCHCMDFGPCVVTSQVGLQAHLLRWTLQAHHG